MLSIGIESKVPVSKVEYQYRKLSTSTLQPCFCSVLSLFPNERVSTCIRVIGKTLFLTPYFMMRLRMI